MITDPSRRIGRFSVPTKFARRFSTDLKRIMGLCIVVRAEQKYHRDEIEYFALSEHFRPIAEGEMPPEYKWSFDEGGHPAAHEVVW